MYSFKRTISQTGYSQILIPLHVGVERSPLFLRVHKCSRSGNKETLLPASTSEQDDPPEGGQGRLDFIITW